jgi:hypothetical protein
MHVASHLSLMRGHSCIVECHCIQALHCLFTSDLFVTSTVPIPGIADGFRSRRWMTIHAVTLSRVSCGGSCPPPKRPSGEGGQHSAPFACTVLTRDFEDAIGSSATTGGLLLRRGYVLPPQSQFFSPFSD